MKTMLTSVADRLAEISLSATSNGQRYVVKLSDLEARLVLATSNNAQVDDIHDHVGKWLARHTEWSTVDNWIDTPRPAVDVIAVLRSAAECPVSHG